jgi:hypothetical protein
MILLSEVIFILAYFYTKLYQYLLSSFTEDKCVYSEQHDIMFMLCSSRTKITDMSIKANFLERLQ